jgi:hypothetical protein
LHFNHFETVFDHPSLMESRITLAGNFKGAIWPDSIGLRMQVPL